MDAGRSVWIDGVSQKCWLKILKISEKLFILFFDVKYFAFCFAETILIHKIFIYELLTIFRFFCFSKKPILWYLINLLENLRFMNFRKSVPDSNRTSDLAHMPFVQNCQMSHLYKTAKCGDCRKFVK